MWAAKKQTGFTIVETLIVMAVVGVLFISTTLLVQGQIEKYQQRDGVLQLESSIRTTLNDVTNGYYPDTGQGITCTVSGNNVTAVSLSAAATPGTNKQCVYAGKKVTFTGSDIVIDTYAAANVASMPPLANLRKIDGLTETKTYKWQMSPTTSTTGTSFWILNTAYSPLVTAGNFVSGTQNVGLFDGATNTAITGSKTYCFSNGAVNSSLTLTGQGGLQVSSQQKSSCS